MYYNKNILNVKKNVFTYIKYITGTDPKSRTPRDRIRRKNSDILFRKGE